MIAESSFLWIWTVLNTRTYLVRVVVLEFRHQIHLPGVFARQRALEGPKRWQHISSVNFDSCAALVFVINNAFVFLSK